MRHAIFVAAILMTLAGCSSPSLRAHNTQPRVGGDSDAHGCIGSAGYAWCARLKSCQRPWKLAKSQGFDNTSQAFNNWCHHVDDSQ